LKIIAVGGPPGSGKTTLMKSVMGEFSDKLKFFDDFKLVPYYKILNIYILGSYPIGETFGGTDRMSMACQPQVIKFIEQLPSESVVLFEGDRLFNQSFLEYCNEKYDLSIVILETTNEEKNRRYKLRGSEQNEKWLAGRETKVNNLRSNFDLMPKIEVMRHENEEDTMKIHNYIIGLI